MTRRRRKLRNLRGMLKFGAGVFTGEAERVRQAHNVYRIWFDEMLIDTCMVNDTHKWETYVNRNNEPRIVQQYESEDEARSGHEEWVAKLKANRHIELPNINVWEVEE